MIVETKQTLTAIVLKLMELANILFPLEKNLHSYMSIQFLFFTPFLLIIILIYDTEHLVTFDGDKYCILQRTRN